MNATETSANDNPASHADDAGILRDPYAVLGVSRDASYEVIRQMYREKAKICHPDLGTELGREEEFILLNWAHRLLSENHRQSTKFTADRDDKEKARTRRASSPRPVVSSIAELLSEGRMRLDCGYANDAEKLARLGLQRAPEDTGAYVLLSEALAGQSRFTEAVGCILMALQLDKDCPEARTVFARLKDRSQHG